MHIYYHFLINRQAEQRSRRTKIGTVASILATHMIHVADTTAAILCSISLRAPMQTALPLFIYNAQGDFKRHCAKETPTASYGDGLATTPPPISLLRRSRHFVLALAPLLTLASTTTYGAPHSYRVRREIHFRE
jgi:hypothetical protein